MRKSWITALLMSGLWVTPLTAQGESLTIVSWGGAYEESQDKAYFAPYQAATGVSLTTQAYNGGIQELKQRAATGQTDWDLIDLVIADNIEACNLGLLEPIDHSLLPAAPDGTIATLDFLPGTLTRCGVGQIVSATVLAYHEGVFTGEKPSTVNDLFDLQRFPGKRGLQRKPIAILEWALLSYGVPVKDVYRLLSTERGMRMAFARLDEIKEHIIWWENGSEPVELLKQRKVVMSSGYNGRFFDSRVNDQQPIEIVWHGQLINYSTWGIPVGSSKKELAQEFILFATDTRRLADQAKYIAYGPARRSSSVLISKHEETGFDMRTQLPTYAPHQEHAIIKDHLWYAKTQARITGMFEQWVKDP